MLDMKFRARVDAMIKVIGVTVRGGVRIKVSQLLEVRFRGLGLH